MQGTLVLTILNLRSSYQSNAEQPLGKGADVPDTIQWWIATTGSWRIRTYAIDHDIHTHALGNSSDLEALAIENARRHYGDVIQSQHVIRLNDALDATAISAAFRAVGLEPRIEIATGRFAFWKPDDGRYQTLSKPR